MRDRGGKQVWEQGWAGSGRVGVHCGQGGAVMLGRRLKGAGQVPLRATGPTSLARGLWMVVLALPLKGAERGGESVSVHQPGCFINAPQQTGMRSTPYGVSGTSPGGLPL